VTPSLSLTVERAYASLPHFDWVEQARNSLALPEQSEKIRVRSEKPTHPTIERVRIAFGRSTKGTESLTIHMVRDLSLIHHMGEGALAHSTAKERVLTHGSTNGPPSISRSIFPKLFSHPPQSPAEPLT